MVTSYAPSTKEPPSLLPAYRVLDLTLGVGHLCGKVLGDMGMDVIKLEPPMGDPARRRGLDVEGAGSWWQAYNTSKRGITLDLSHKEARALFKDLVREADFVIESYPPGTLEQWGLGWRELERIRPSLIVTSITAFGQYGEHSTDPGSDLTLMALGGFMSETGYPDRGPVRIGLEQAFLHASAHAAAATLAAHVVRLRKGSGQHVDVSAHQAVAEISDIPLQFWILTQQAGYRGSGARFSRDSFSMRLTWPCKDGHVVWRLNTGRHGRVTRTLVDWMDSLGVVHSMAGVPWEELDMAELNQELVDVWEAEIGKFFASMTKAQLMADPRSRVAMVYPCNTVKDILQQDQLRARDFFISLHKDKGYTLFPGSLWLSNATQTRPRCPAPTVGAHNVEIYCGELGLSPSEVTRFTQQGAL